MATLVLPTDRLAADTNRLIDELVASTVARDAAIDAAFGVQTSVVVPDRLNAVALVALYVPPEYVAYTRARTKVVLADK